MQKLLTPADLADLLGLKIQTVYNRICKGRDLPPSIKTGRVQRWRPADVESWLEAIKQAQHQSTPVAPQKPVIQEAKRRRGRPTKQEQIARREAAGGACKGGRSSGWRPTAPSADSDK